MAEDDPQHEGHAHAHAHEGHAHAHEGLDVEVERRDDGTATVTFTVSPDELRRTVEHGLRGMAKRTKMKGFRPGKVPLSFLERRFGDEARREAVQHFLNHAYDAAVREHGLNPAAHPRVDLEALLPEPGAGLTGTFDVWLKPDVELGDDYKGMAVEARSTDVTDEEVEETIADVRRQRSRPERIGEDGELPEDGMAVASLAFVLEGEEEPVLAREGIRLGPKSPPAGVDPDAFRAALAGAPEGAERTVPIEFPDVFPEERARGKKGELRITVVEGFRIVPPTDEDLRGLFGVEDEEALRAEVRRRVAEAKEEQERMRVEGELLERLVADHPLRLPEAYVEERMEARLAETRRELASQGLSEEAAASQAEGQREELRASTEKALRAVYLMEAIAEREGLQVTRDDLARELREIAERNDVPPQEVASYYQEQNLLGQLALELLERKVRSFLRESADMRTAG